jgi:hypothetical protein
MARLSVASWETDCDLRFTTRTVCPSSSGTTNRIHSQNVSIRACSNAQGPTVGTYELGSGGPTVFNDVITLKGMRLRVFAPSTCVCVHHARF